MMKRCVNAIGILFAGLLVTSMLWAGESAFYRIIGPSGTRITEIRSDGTVAWSNSVPGSGSVLIQRSLNLQDSEGWRDHARVQMDIATASSRVFDLLPPERMVLVPGGSNGGIDPDFGPYLLTVSSFYMDQYPVTQELWDKVASWALENGYDFETAGLAKGTNHPVHSVNWYDAVKWCNARSEMEGRPAVYTVEGAVYRSGREDDVEVSHLVGYRLPTAEESGYAARGGVQGKRFPWGDTINHDYANYLAHGSGSLFDTSPYTSFTYHPSFEVEDKPYTSPVGSFPANEFGLYDMVGNVREWCFDGGRWSRVVRGGSWGTDAYYSRVGWQYSLMPFSTGSSESDLGFRTVLSAGSERERKLVLRGNLDFGAIPLATTSARDLVLANHGTDVLTVEGLDLPEGFSGDWSGAIHAGSTQIVRIAFAPQEGQMYAGEVTVRSDATSGLQALPIIGIGDVDDIVLDTYLVVDLSEGPTAARYPIAYYDAVPVGGWTEEYKTTKLVMRRIAAGTFMMGSPAGELGRNANREAMREVTLTRDFYIGVFPVTQKQWERVMGDWPSGFNHPTYRNSRPLENRSWDDVRGGTWPGGPPAGGGFMQQIHSRTGLAFDLPTEAQWEYACRAGTLTALNSGKNLTGTVSCPNVGEVGRYWFNGGSDVADLEGDPSEGTSTVGSYLPNAWGLYDMHGNVWELCLDWYEDAPDGTIDPVGPSSGPFLRVNRGGSWTDGEARVFRSAHRDSRGITTRRASVGFRLALTMSVD